MNKIFIGVNEIAGYAKGLETGFRELGYTADFYDLYESNFYSESIKAGIVKIHRKIAKKCKLISIFLRILIFIQCLYKYDIFIFLYCKSFFGNRELFIYKILNKKVVSVCLGSDSRPAFLNGALFSFNDLSNEVNKTINNLYNIAKKQKNRIKRIEKNVDFIIDHSATGHFHEKPFILWSWVGFPRKEVCSDYKITEDINKTNIKILHAPSKADSKGTPIIRDIIKSLKSKKYNIEYIELINKKNSEVLEEIKTADLIFDEINSDIFLGGLGIEASIFGKPTIVGGLYFEHIYSDNKEINMPEVFYSTPEKLEEKIEAICKNKDLLEKTGKKAKEYVYKTFNPKEVAKKYIKILNGDEDVHYFNPNNIQYIKGYGATVLGVEYKELLRNYLNKYGKEGLFFKDKPNLIEDIIKYIND